MNENTEPIATPPAAQPTPATAPSTKRTAGLWAGVLTAVIVAGGAGYAAGAHLTDGDRIDRVSFNGPMMGPDGHMDADDQRRMGPGMGPGKGPHCENAAGDHTPVNADGSCPTGYTLDDRGMRNTQPAPEASASPTS